MSTSVQLNGHDETDSGAKAGGKYRAAALSSSSSSSIENISYISKGSNKNINESIDEDSRQHKKSTKSEDADYDHCKEFKFASPTRQQPVRSSAAGTQHHLRNASNTGVKTSPMKRSKANSESYNGSTTAPPESPNKRQRFPNNPTVSHLQQSSPRLSNRISTSLCLENTENKSKYASTPKSERRVNPASRLKQLKDSEEVQRNLSTSWADIIEELEQQSKELTDYSDKVAEKYSLDKEKLKKSLELDSEILRKRQKQINYGKLTPEYQRYVLAVQKKHREPFHPRTPNKFRKCSRRKFDGCVKKWRKLLHVWDESPDKLRDFKHSIDEDDQDAFGGTSNIDHSSILYNVDDYDIVDYEVASPAAEKPAENSS